MQRVADCVVVGGGVIGLTAARRLATDGLRVVLLERGVCGGEASWAGAGVLSPPNPHRADGVARLQHRSLELYAAFCAELAEETGIDPEYERCGQLEVLHNENALKLAREDLEAAAGRTMPDRTPVYALHDAAETVRLEPAVSENTLGSLECRQSAQVRNPRLLQALTASCVKKGVEIREQTPVGDLLLERGRVVGVVTERGPVQAGGVVLAAGAWSSGIAARLGEVMPVHPVRGQMILMRVERRPFTRIISRGRSYLVPRRDGRVLLGSTEEPEAGFTKKNTAGGIAKLVQTALEMVPGMGDAPIEATWSGLRPGTPDDRPYIGPVPGFEGLIAAAGHFRTGLTSAPATAEAVAAMIAGEAPALDLSDCQPGRAARR